MATNNDVACDDPLSLVCKLCDKPYQHKDGPLLLPCLHSFCKPCLTEYVKKAPAADNKMACPTCNDRFPQDINQLTLIANPFKITARQSRDYSNFQNMQVTYKNVGGTCTGVAVHDNGTVYVSYYNAHTIKVFKPNGEETQIGSSDKAGRQLSHPRGIALIGDTIYVVSFGNDTVKMYSTDGRFIGGFGSKGNGAGQLRDPLGICTDGKGRVLVADNSNKRIQIFTSQGVFIKSIGCSTQPYDVAVDPEGNIHAALPGNNHIAIYSEDGNLIDTYDLGERLHCPQAIYIDGEGNRLIGTHNDPVHIADPTGTLIATRQVDESYGVTMDKNGIIYVAEYINQRVSIYN